MSACLSATEDKKTKGGNSVVVYISSALFLCPFFDHILYKLRDARPSLFSFFFFSLSTIYKARRERENDDHHIIFVVTIEVCMRAYSSFLPTSVHCPFSFIIIRLLCIFFFLRIWHAKELVLSFFMHSWLAIGNTRLYHLTIHPFIFYRTREFIYHRLTIKNWIYCFCPLDVFKRMTGKYFFFLETEKFNKKKKYNTSSNI